MMHRPIAEQGLYLKRVVNGFLNYFAVPTNSRAINSFYRHVGWYWCRALQELWPKLGDGSVRRAAYRGGWKPA